MQLTGRLFDPARAVLVVVDEQERLMPAIHDAGRVIAVTARLVRFADTVGLPVLFTEQYPKGLGGTIAEVRELLGVRIPIEKTAFGCFGCVEFAAALTAGRYETILLAGVETHICVFQTAAEALDRGLAVHVMTDAVSARTVEQHEIGLERLRQVGGVTSSSEMAIYEFLREAATPLFRSVLPLLKE